MCYTVNNKLPLFHAYHGISEYIHDLISYGKRSPQDVNMHSPEETTYKNILINIRDKPRITDETVTIKKARKTNFLLPTHTDSISPIADSIKPKMAYLDKVSPSYVPGKAVKIVSDATKHVIQDDKVNISESTYCSLDSYLRKDDIDYELYRRRVSEGNMEQVVDEPIKKRCSSTIRKLRPEDMKKSKSEVTKLCDKMKSIKLKDKESKNYRTRSCNDIVRLILTKHGIHVISDTEAIV